MTDYAANSFDGAILSVEDDRILMKRDCPWGTENVVITVAEDTKILDTENGYPVLAGNLKMGMPIRAYVGEAMTLSLPPITNGHILLYGSAPDSCFPIYAVIKWVEETADGQIHMVVMDGTEIYMDENTTLLPYLTRNLIRKEDLTPGRRILIWPDAENTSRAQKIILFMD